MTVIDAAPVELDPKAARILTDRIKTTVDDLWQLLAEAHERRAWKALGYLRWEDYVGREFAMSARRSYQILDQAKVIHAIAAVCTPVHISEGVAREIRPQLPEVVAAVTARAEELGPDATDDDREQMVADVIEETRSPALDRTPERVQQLADLIGHIGRFAQALGKHTSTALTMEQAALYGADLQAASMHIACFVQHLASAS